MPMAKEGLQVIEHGIREWLSLEETMQELGKSRATIERLCAAQELRSKLEPRTGRKPERFYSAGDVEKLKGRQLNREALVPAPARAITLAMPGLEQSLEKLVAAIPSTHREEVRKPWLTLEEAAEEWRFTPRFLRGLIRQGKLIAVRGGPRGALRICRESLERYRG